MTPQELKNSILQLAVQGKLVEQRAEEGTAEELYKKIQEEKQKLVAEKKIKKEKSLPEITAEEIPFDIPESWKWVRLGEILRVISGVSYKKGDVTSKGIRILRGGNIQNGKIILDDNDVFLPVSYVEEEKCVQEGDIIIVASTGSKAVIGKAGFIERKLNDTMIGAFLRICRAYSSCTQNYLKYLFESDYYRKHIRELSQGTNINNIKESYITEFVVPFPPLEEQKRIVAKIEELLPQIDRYEKAWSKLEEFNKRFPEDMQKSILQYAMQGKLVEQRAGEGTAEELYKKIQAEKQKLTAEKKIKKEKPLPEITAEEIPFEIPESWKWVRLGDIGFTQTGNTPSKNHPEYFGNDIPFITPGDINNCIVNYKNRKISYLGEAVARIAHEGSVLQVCIGGSIGKACMIDRKVSFNQQINAIYPYVCISNYILCVLMSNFFILKIKECAGGTATPIINKGLWDKLLVPLPPLEEQKRIVAKIKELLPLCERLKK